MRYSAERQEALFDKKLDLEAERGTDSREWKRKFGHQPGWIYRTKRIACGDYLEYEAFPVWDGEKDDIRAKKVKPTEEAQRALNQKNTRKKLIRLMNTNFGEEDLFVTLTYRGEQPGSVEEARKDMQAYIKRLKRWREKRGLPEFKYIYVTEHEGDGRKKRVHHHLVMSGMDRDEAERIWGMGRANSHKLQPDENGLEGLARYITKGKQLEGKKSYCYSRNLQKPKVTVSDSRVSKRAVERLATDDAEIRAQLQRREPGFIINDVTIHRSDYVPGAYVTVRLRRITPRGSPPRIDSGKRKKGEEDANQKRAAKKTIR